MAIPDCPASIPARLGLTLLSLVDGCYDTPPRLLVAAGRLRELLVSPPEARTLEAELAQLQALAEAMEQEEVTLPRVGILLRHILRDIRNDQLVCLPLAKVTPCGSEGGAWDRVRTILGLAGVLSVDCLDSSAILSLVFFPDLTEEELRELCQDQTIVAEAMATPFRQTLLPVRLRERFQATLDQAAKVVEG